MCGKAEETLSPKPEIRKSVYRIWLSGVKMRVDERVGAWTTRRGRMFPEHTSVRCRGCYSDDTILQQSDEMAPPGSRGPKAATITDIKLVPPKLPLLPNPLILGLAPVPWIQTERVKLDAYIGLRNKQDVRITEMEVQGQTRIDIEYQRVVGNVTSEVRIVVAPEQGDSIVSLTEQTVLGGRKLEFSLHCENELHRETGIWFPSKVAFERHDGDEKAAGRDTCEIEVVSLNARIDDRVFSLEGIETLKQGTLIHRVGEQPDPNFNDGKARWDGKRLDSEGGKSGDIHDCAAGMPRR
jgi:hypothetical protein